MNYILSNDFLFTSDSCTSIEFVLSDKLFVYEDFNRRTLVVEYIDDMKYSELNEYISSFTSYTNNKITPIIYNLREHTSTIINGVKYFINSKYKLLSCVLCKGHNELISSNNSLMIVTDGTLSSYKKLLNSVNIIKTENLDSLSVVSEFGSINLDLPFSKSFSNVYVNKYQEFSINDSMIVSAFVDALNKHLPEYTIAPELNKEFIKDQKQNIIIYEAKLAEHGDGYSTHVRYSPDLGRYAQTELEVSLEILSDDFETYLHTRDLLIMNKHLYSLTTFILTDKYGKEWSYSCNWSMNELNSEIDRSPKSKYFDETILYSIQLNVRLIGWLIEKFNNNAVRISDPLVLTYTNNPGFGSIIKEFVVDGTKYKDEFLIDEYIDLNYTNIYYNIDNVSHLAQIDVDKKTFYIDIDSGTKYTGSIDNLVGLIKFNDRYLINKVKYDSIIINNGPTYEDEIENLLMDKGTIKVVTKKASTLDTTYKIVAEIIPDTNQYLITNLSDYLTTDTGRKIIVYCNVEYLNTEFRYVYYGYSKGYHIFSINEDLLDKIKSNFEELYRDGQSVIIVSSHNEVKGDRDDTIINSSGNTKNVLNYIDYNLYNYSNDKFIKIKELKL